MKLRQVFAGMLTFTAVMSAAIFIKPASVSAALSVGQISLYFMDEGRRTETTAVMGSEGLKVNADVTVEGSGQLEGYWEVDGRRLENVSRRINFKQKLTLSTSRVPGTPSFEPGLHRVRFVVTSPSPAFTLPTVTYFVSGAISGELTAVALKKPRDGFTVKGKATFKWRKLPDASLYILTFHESEDEKATFAAMVKKNFYKLDTKIMKNYFKSGTPYFWKVAGVNQDGDILGESEMRKFTVRGE